MFKRLKIFCKEVKSQKGETEVNSLKSDRKLKVCCLNRLKEIYERKEDAKDRAKLQAHLSTGRF